MGEDLQAFSDFLFYILNGSNALLSELAIAVFDSTSGGVEVYRGVHYPEPHAAAASCATSRPSGGGGSSAAAAASTPEGSSQQSDEQQRANLLCIKYLPGHYQALVGANHVTGVLRGGPTLVELLRCLDLLGVRYVITDDASG